MSDEPSTPPVAKKSGRVTHADIARESGVSRATVSYVLNNTDGRAISSSTRELVRSTAQKLGHVPFAPARSLRLGRSDIVLALVPDYSFGFVSTRVLRALDVALAKRGFVLLVHRLDEDLRSLMELWGLVSPTLVIAMGGFELPEEFVVDEARTKIVRVHGLVDQVEAGELQAEYLLSKGHTLFGYAYPAVKSLGLVARERYDGFAKACRARGVEDPVVCQVDTDDPETIFAAVDRWQSVEPPLTAIAAHNDEIAVTISTAMIARGMKYPDRFAVMGIDNIPSARINLTTVALDIDSWGDAVVRRVQDVLDDREFERYPPRHFLRLIIRDTA